MIQYPVSGLVSGRWRICMYMYMYVCIYIYIYIYMHVCMYIYIYIYLLALIAQDADGLAGDARVAVGVDVSDALPSEQ